MSSPPPLWWLRDCALIPIKFKIQAQIVEDKNGLTVATGRVAEEIQKLEKDF